PQPEAAEKARRAADHALEIDPNLAEGHAALGVLYQIHEFDFAAAEMEYRRAIELNPNYASVYGFYAMLLAEMKRFEGAIAEAERGQAIDPLSLIIATQAGNVLYFAGQYDRALEIEDVSSLRGDNER